MTERLDPATKEALKAAIAHAQQALANRSSDLDWAMNRVAAVTRLHEAARFLRRPRSFWPDLLALVVALALVSFVYVSRPSETAFRLEGQFRAVGLTLGCPVGECTYSLLPPIPLDSLSLVGMRPATASTCRRTDDATSILLGDASVLEQRPDAAAHAMLSLNELAVRSGAQLSVEATASRTWRLELRGGATTGHLELAVRDSVLKGVGGEWTCVDGEAPIHTLAFDLGADAAIEVTPGPGVASIEWETSDLPVTALDLGRRTVDENGRFRSRSGILGATLALTGLAGVDPLKIGAGEHLAVGPAPGKAQSWARLQGIKMEKGSIAFVAEGKAGVLRKGLESSPDDLRPRRLDVIVHNHALVALWAGSLALFGYWKGIRESLGKESS